MRSSEFRGSREAHAGPVRAGRRLFRRLLVLLAIAVAPGPALAQEAFEFDVSVLHATPTGSVDRAAGRFHRLLGKRVRYEGLRVVTSKSLRVATNDIGSVKLPDGVRFGFRPIDPEGPGVLVAIDMGQTQGDFRLPAGKPLVLGGSAWKGGQLVVVLELR